MIVFHLQRHMPVADVIGNAGKLGAIRSADFVQAFVGSEHLDHATVLQGELVAMREHRAHLELDTDGLPVRERGSQTGALPLVEGEFNRFNGRYLPGDEMGC